MTATENLSEYTAQINTVVGSMAETSPEGWKVWKLDSPLRPSSVKLVLVGADDKDKRDWVEAVGTIGLWEVRVVGLARQPVDFLGIGRIIPE